MATPGESLTRSLRFRIEPDGAELVVRPEIVVVAGYTGRDREAVLDHIGELERLGVPPPPTVPTFYAVSPELLTQGNAVVTTETATSGEAEAGLVVADGEVYVTVCSDHTDRAAERLDIALSKRACHKVVGTSAWRLTDIADRWDTLHLRSWIGDEPTLYQDGTLGLLVPPLELRDAIPWREQPECFVLMCGTVPTVAGIEASPRFRAELFDPIAERSLELDYAVATLDLLRLEPTDSVRLA
jgi:Protein of unknown function (DUF2848)